MTAITRLDAVIALLDETGADIHSVYENEYREIIITHEWGLISLGPNEGVDSIMVDPQTSRVHTRRTLPNNERPT